MKYLATVKENEKTAISAEFRNVKDGCIIVNCPELGFIGDRQLLCFYGLSIPYMKVMKDWQVWIEPTIGNSERFVYTGIADFGTAPAAIDHLQFFWETQGIYADSDGMKFGVDSGALLKLLISKDIEMQAGSTGGTLKAKSSGDLEVNGSADNAVSWNDLNTALQSFVSAINTAFAAKLDGGGSSPTLSLDISSAKVATVKLP